MSIKTYESLVDALAELTTRSYKEDFELERTCLYCDGLDLMINPEDFVDKITASRIICQYRHVRSLR